jgi:hypothetical protein
VAFVFELHVSPFELATHTPDAAHPETHELNGPGVTFHEAPEQVEIAAEHTAPTGAFVEYDVHEPPDAVLPQAPTPQQMFVEHD